MEKTRWLNNNVPIIDPTMLINNCINYFQLTWTRIWSRLPPMDMLLWQVFGKSDFFASRLLYRIILCVIIILLLRKNLYYDGNSQNWICCARQINVLSIYLSILLPFVLICNWTQSNRLYIISKWIQHLKKIPKNCVFKSWYLNAENICSSILYVRTKYSLLKNQHTASKSEIN